VNENCDFIVCLLKLEMEIEQKKFILNKTEIKKRRGTERDFFRTAKYKK
jgi:hypothetical protein